MSRPKPVYVDTWKFRITIDEREVKSQIDSIGNGRPITLSSRLKNWGIALDNGERYLERKRFSGYEDGSLREQVEYIKAKEIHEIEIRLMDCGNVSALNQLCHLYGDVNAKTPQGSFNERGFRLQGMEMGLVQPIHIFRFDHNGLFIYDRRASWDSSAIRLVERA